MTSQKISTPRTAPGFLALVSAGVLLLSGCAGGSPEPGSSLTASQTASPTASPTPTSTPSAVYRPADASGPAQNVPVPVLPAVAKTETKEGLEAFARYWYSTLSYAYETGDMRPLEAISEPTCKSCAKVKKEVTDWHSEGRWMSGGRMMVEGVHSDFVVSGPAEYQAVIQVSQEKIDYHLPNGTIEGTVPRGPAFGDILIASFTGGTWKAKTVEHLVN